MPANLTERMLRDTKPDPEGKWRSIFDGHAKGLFVRVSPKGSRTFWVAYRDPAGKLRQLRIGGWPEWSVEGARKLAREIRQAADRGEDPARERQEAAAIPTLSAFWAEYLEEMEPKWRPRTRATRRGLWDLICPAFGRKRLDGIRRRDVEEWHRTLTRGLPGPPSSNGKPRGGPVGANRAVALLRAVLGEAVRRELIAANPAQGVKPNREKSREVFLKPDEARRIWEAIAAEEAHGGKPSTPRVGESVPGVRGGRGKREAESRGISVHAAALFRLLMLTGCRTGELREARWSWVDWEAATLRLPAEATKTRAARVVHLSPLALEELRRLWPLRTRGGWIMEGRAEGKPMAPPQKAWQRVRAAADTALDAERAEMGLPPLDPPLFASVKLHDLRHSFASLAVAEGVALAFVSKALGHADPSTTARYAHLADDPARVVALTVGEVISRTLDGAKVLDASKAGAGAGAPEGEDAELEVSK